MKASGYSERFRHQIIESGLKGFEKMVAVAEEGGRPINRKRSWERLQRKRKKMAKSINWHKSGGYHVPLFVPSTPNSELAKRIKAVEERNTQRCIRFKVVEMGGTSVKSLLQRSNPWSGGQCGKDDCFPCKREKGGDCRRSCVTYKITCLECLSRGIIAEYKGETSRNMYARGKEHLQQFKNKAEASFMWAHCKSTHNSQRVEFAMQMTGTFRSSLARQVTEAIQIHNFKGVTMNRKQEFRQLAVARPVFSHELQIQGQ